MRGTTDHIQTEEIVLDATFPDTYLYAKKLRYKLTLYPDFENQRTLLGWDTQLAKFNQKW